MITDLHIGGEASIEQMLAAMDHQIRRLPVIDNHRLAGTVSEADIARHLREHAVAEFVTAIRAPGQSVSPDKSTQPC